MCSNRIAISPKKSEYVYTASQKGAFTELDNAKRCVDNNPGYTVYDSSGTAVYPSADSTVNTFTPCTVNIAIPNLNIRKGPGTNYATTGLFTGKGAFTIVEEKNGQGSDAGWGRLKSGAGWISLDYCTRL